MAGTLLSVPFLEKLQGMKSVLLCGCGGGCDIYAALPLYFHLRSQPDPPKCHLFSLSFTSLDDASPAERIQLPDSGGEMVVVNKSTVCSDASGFPEGNLARWLSECSEGEDNARVYSLPRIHCGVANVIEAYSVLAQQLSVDTIVTVDAGTDSLMAGDEEGLGSYEEDIATVLAAAAVENGVQVRVHCVTGLGVDSFHGCSDVSALRAIAELRRSGGYLGAITMLDSMRPVQLYREAVEHGYNQQPSKTTITNASVLAAVAGSFGSDDPTASERTLKQWINPQMAELHGFSTEKVASRVLESVKDQVMGTCGFESLQDAVVKHVSALKAAGRIRTREEYPEVPFPKPMTSDDQAERESKKDRIKAVLMAAGYTSEQSDEALKRSSSVQGCAKWLAEKGAEPANQDVLDRAVAEEEGSGYH